MSRESEVYMGVDCDMALFLHRTQYGDEGPHEQYICFPLPPGPGNVPIRQVIILYMGTTYRCSVTYAFGDPETNLAVTTHDWRYGPDGDMPETKFQVLEGRLDTFFADLGDCISSGAAVVSYRWHKMKGDGSGPETGSVRFTEKDISFSGSGLLPPQVACSITEMTSDRRRWGRFYLPFLAPPLNSGGRLESSYAALIADSAESLYSLADADILPHVYGAKDPSSLPVRAVRVDDVLDIIRSRRWDSTGLRETRVLEAP